MSEAVFQGIVGGAMFGILAGLVLLVVKTMQAATAKLDANKDRIYQAAEKAAATASSSASKAYKASKGLAQRLSDDDSSIDEKYYEAASSELISGNFRQGLWIKLVALAEGDEQKAKSAYIRARARELRDAE
jgi:hypothetical protein